MSKDARFWRNVILKALAHIALLAGLIRWSLQTKRPSNAQSIIWIGGAENGAGETKRGAPTPVKVLAARAEPTPEKSPKPTPKPGPKKTVLAKASPKPSPKVKLTPTPVKSGEKAEQSDINT